MRRYVGLFDLVILVFAAVVVTFPPRAMYASAAIKADAEHEFATSLAEARTIARPKDGLAVEDLGRRLGEANMKDWAIETTAIASERARSSPTQWRALLATSVAYVDELDVVPALDYANRALDACSAARARGDLAACPDWEQIRMQLYQKHLDGGVKSGIDPRKGAAAAAAFRRAGESELREIRLVPSHPAHTGSAAGATGSGSATAP
ncbi:MAG TPA: hypothetical protein VMJ10_25140 [Kofleriaceae bacterium]|nr:hypothetical protein [Kofleriaceae bacterium]